MPLADLSIRFAQAYFEVTGGKPVVQSSRNSIHTDDLDAICAWERANGVESDRRQLSRGPGLFQTDTAVVGEFLVWRWRESQRLLSEYSLPWGVIEICIARYPEPPIWCGMQIPRSTVAIHVGGESYSTIVPPGGVAYGLVLRRSSNKLLDLVGEEVLTRAMTQKGATAPIPNKLFDQVFPWFDFLLAGDADSHHPTFGVEACCSRVVEACFEVEDNSEVMLPHKGLVDEARSLMSRQLGDAVTVQQVVNELGVSRRALELAFQRHLGVSPHQYLLVERLHVARKMLKRNVASTLEICLNSGFNHPSRFAQMYARHFGELPSQTKKRQR